MAEKNEFDAELFFSALADRTRLRLLNLMRGGEVCVCFFAEALGTNNPKISRHLAYLRRAGLVTARRDGKWMHYKLQPPENEHARQVFDKTLEMFAADKQMSADIRKLDRVCCAPATLVRLRSFREKSSDR